MTTLPVIRSVLASQRTPPPLPEVEPFLMVKPWRVTPVPPVCASATAVPLPPASMIVAAAPGIADALADALRHSGAL